ncbi:hypothetical protein VT84_06350 [Gemmata sp. SH-PL17]|nr:hypothetical protein VT84_06350 [Gemmata sp. SH-PL17]
MNFAVITRVQSDLEGVRELEHECLRRWYSGEGSLWSEHASVIRGWVPWTIRIEKSPVSRQVC